MGVSWKRATPSHHSFLDRLSNTKQPFVIGDTPILGNLHIFETTNNYVVKTNNYVVKPMLNPSFLPLAACQAFQEKGEVLHYRVSGHPWVTPGRGLAGASH